MEKYIYILPYKIRSIENEINQEEILTQKSSLIIEKTPLLDILKEILLVANNRSIVDVYQQFKEKINNEKFLLIIDFLKKHNLIHISENLLSKQEIRFVKFLSQYTISFQKYLNKMENITFQIYSEGDNIEYLIYKLDYFGFNYNLFKIDDIETFDENNIVLVSVNSSEIDYLDKLSKKIEAREGLLWMFALYYDDSVLISPILNQFNYTNYSSLKKQVNLHKLNSNTISANKFVQDIGINILLLELLTSIMKLNIHTLYNKMIVYNSSEKKLYFDKIYYYPKQKKFDEKILAIQRWDDEI